MNYKYRIVLSGEDGTYVLKDGYTEVRKAQFVMDNLRKSYGEGQRLFIEAYV